jgi:8-oxo-dGTP pyrophosphatase MutT (NUDIX family)
LKSLEAPETGLRRELYEELGLRVMNPCVLGDWRDRHQVNRVFGCQIVAPIDWYNRDEIKSIGWFALDTVRVIQRRAGPKTLPLRRLEERPRLGTRCLGRALI